MKSGVELIKEKRECHIKKGYNYDHDTEHTPMQFVNAAIAYALNDPYKWPFDKQSLKLRGDLLDNLINAGSLIATAIDRILRYEVGKTYRVICNHQSGTFKVLKVKMLKRGDIFVTFTGLSGDLLSDKQTFMIGSLFDVGCTPI